VPNHFDFEKPEFDIKEIYQFYERKHERKQCQSFFDRWFSENLTKFSITPQDYESLYVRTKELGSLVQKKLDAGV
jgi:hypothetical protein